MPSTDYLIEAAKAEEQYGISIGGFYVRMMREEAARLMSANGVIGPGLCTKFHDECERQGLNEITVLESLIREWLSKQDNKPIVTYAG